MLEFNCPNCHNEIAIEYIEDSCVVECAYCKSAIDVVYSYQIDTSGDVWHDYDFYVHGENDEPYLVRSFTL